MFIDVKYLYKLVFAPMEVKLNKMLDTNYVNVDKYFLFELPHMEVIWHWKGTKDLVLVYYKG